MGDLLGTGHGSIIGAEGDFLNNIMSPGGGPGKPRTVGLDPQTQGLIRQQSAEAGASTEQNAGILNKGIGQGQLGGTQQQTEANTGMTPAMKSAMGESYAASAGQGLSRLKEQNMMNAYMMKADKMHKLSQSLLQQQLSAQNQFKFLSDSLIQSEMARANAINSLFQTADVGIGMYAGKYNKPGGQKGMPTGQGMVGGYSPQGVNYGNDFSDIA